jgi:hypothetical protein
MNKGVEILLARMESNPDEFVVKEGVVGKWDNIVRAYENVLDPEDAKAYKDAKNALLQQQFTSEVMKELLDPKSLELEDVINQYRMKGIPSVGQTLASSMAQSKAMITGATLTANSNSLTLGNTTINESHLEHLRAHVDAMKREVDSQESKKPKTIFGRLFNYQ